MPTVADFPKEVNGRRDDRARELRASIDAGIDALAKSVDAVRASDEFRRFLDMQARFHRYSWHNTLLIASQRPDATQVAGYKTWQSLKRQVRKGERGIAIFAPCPFKREETTDAGETETRQGIYFRVVFVFDVAQTDGEALPIVDCPSVDVAADSLLSRLTDVATKRGIAVEFRALSAGFYGSSQNGRIEVSNEHPTGQQAKTLAHELAHEALHWKENERGTFTRSLAELEAESVAYVVCRHFGLDVEVRASRYIALWQGDGKALRESLQRISETARGIIDDCDAVANRKAVA